jgi:hypothetical protein
MYIILTNRMYLFMPCAACPAAASHRKHIPRSACRFRYPPLPHKTPAKSDKKLQEDERLVFHELSDPVSRGNHTHSSAQTPENSAARLSRLQNSVARGAARPTRLKPCGCRLGGDPADPARERKRGVRRSRRARG